MFGSKCSQRVLAACSAVLLFGQAGALHAQEAESGVQPLETVDLKKMDCRDLLSLGGESRDDVILFMQGYLSGWNKEQVLDLDGLAAATDKAVSYCIDNPSKTLIEAFSQAR